MKTFRQILENTEETQYYQNFYNLNPSEYIYYNDGKWVIDTFHRLDRFKQRSSGITGLYDLFNDIIKYLSKKGKRNFEYLFLKKSTNQGIVVTYRPDKKKKVKGDQVVLITFFGNVEKEFGKTIDEMKAKNPKDIRVVLESKNFSARGMEVIILE